MCPAATITDVAARRRPRAAAKDLELTLALAPDLPAEVPANAVRLRQVLLNLAGNALKLTARGHVEIALTVPRAGARLATLRFRVRDTGIGMDPTAQAKLFRVFAQGDSSMARRFGGTDLGLAISQRLVNRRGGQIMVQSRTGQGSEFSFELTLPRATTPLPLLPAPRAHLARRQGAGSRGRPRQSTRHPPAGRKARPAGRDRRRQGRGSRHGHPASLGRDPDGLPDARDRRVRGKETGAAKTGRAPLPIIPLTANALTGDRQDCKHAGMDDFLAKPVRQEELRAWQVRWLRPPAA